MPKREIGKKRFEQTLQIGDVVALLNTSGFLTDAGAETSLYEVTMAEHIPLVGQHGLVLCFVDGASTPAGYKADANAVTNQHIASGSSINVAPAALQLQRGQLFQFRSRFKVLATLGVAVQDIDVTAFLPSSVQRWRVGSTNNGVLNSINQVPDPADATVLPAQGSNEALPSAYASESAWDAAWKSELWTYYDQNPSFTFQNNGSGATSGGAFGLEISGNLYNVRPLSAGNAPRQTEMLGYTVTAPADINPRADVTIIPVAGRSVY